jgi:hypothetical protein
MSTTFNPTLDLQNATASADALRVSFPKDAFTKKTSSGVTNSWFLPTTSTANPPVGRVHIEDVKNIYQNTAVPQMYQLPLKSGKKATLSVFGYGKMTCDSDDCKVAIVPLELDISVKIPDADILASAGAYDELYEIMLATAKSLVPTTSRVIGEGSEHPVTAECLRWSLLAMGVKDTVANLDD